MLSMTNTPNHTGVKISGDYFDLDQLNQAIYRILGKEGQYYHFEGSRLRILGISYDLRHAAQGDRNVESVFNGLHDHTKKQHGFIAPDKNIYFSVELLWPELLFAALALKDFVSLYSDETKYPNWDIYLPVISNFQALVLDCLRGQVSEEEYQAVLRAFNESITFNDYAIQFVDYLNLKYIDMTKKQREKNLALVALKLATRDQDYFAFKKQVMAAAEPAKKPIHEIRLQAEYPEDFEW